MTPLRLRRAALLLLAPGLLLTPAAHAALAKPRPVSPANGARSEALPAFGWMPVKGADHYEFQIAPDGQFRSQVHGVRERVLKTRNLYATVGVAVPDGDYWWRTRAVAVDGTPSRWSVQRRIVKSWAAGGALVWPEDGAALTYPDTPMTLRWTPVRRAAKYLIEVAKDPEFATIVFDGGKPQETAATEYTVLAALPAGTYWWRVTPLDAKKNRGAPSRAQSFVWRWSNQKPTIKPVTDVQPDLASVFDPRFAWNAVPGAVSYEVEVSSSQDWAPSSRVCCTDKTTGLSLYPKKLFANNDYYWRVRAFDVDGNAGVWSDTGSFVKDFANLKISNLTLRSPEDAVLPTGSRTGVPIVGWDPVPGASAYEVQVGPHQNGTCDYSATNRSETWDVKTATAYWTPLATGLRVQPPLRPTNIQIGQDILKGLVANHSYCVRVRALSDRDTANGEVYGPYTELEPSGRRPSFTYDGNPSGGAAPCNPCDGLVAAGDYLAPGTGVSRDRAPLLTWRPTRAAGTDNALPARYFVIVARDRELTKIVDYAFTEIPAYAPRVGPNPRTFSEETTTFYWVAIPARNPDGGGTSSAIGDLLARQAAFDKRTAPPTPLPSSREQDHQTLSWSLVPWARSYRVQVAIDAQFANLIDDVETNATAFTSERTYPAAPRLYWRVRAMDENKLQFAWSAVQEFVQDLPAPAPLADKSAGDDIPTMRWRPVPGAVSYDLHVEQPDGVAKDFPRIRSSAATFVRHYGTGAWRWRVRANFPDTRTTQTPGPYSPTSVYVRTTSAPLGVANGSRVRGGVLFTWLPKDGSVAYRVEVSERPDFARLLEPAARTDATSYAPTLASPGAMLGGTIWWRVAAVDEGGNVGKFSAPVKIALARGMRVTVSGRPGVGRSTTLAVVVRTGSGQAVRGAVVRVSGAGIRP
ncbi:MAG: hypothetical protein AVDCRST_MAG79-1871, partial [uncultured Thermoleophilia bacterium]